MSVDELRDLIMSYAYFAPNEKEEVLNCWSYWMASEIKNLGFSSRI